jgi:murein DD-endopeptidase MepM/ murein hydrolase activator NlpD
LVLCVVTLFLASPATMAQVTLSGEAIQGGLLHGRAPAGSAITFMGKKVAVAPDGTFALGFERDAKPQALLVARTADGRVINRRIVVKQRTYKIQRIDGLPGRKVSPQKRDMKRIIAENKLLVAARRRLSLDAFFKHGFIWPAKGRISGVYGSQRILNGKPRRPHLGLDIAAPTGTPVVAAADGVVALTHQDMFFTGKTVLLDHGLEVGTTYIHMSAIAVKQGQRVRRGQLIGRIGKTGRSTGPHLHWGLTWRGIRLDPATVVGPMPKK